MCLKKIKNECACACFVCVIDPNPNTNLIAFITQPLSLVMMLNHSSRH